MKIIIESWLNVIIEINFDNLSSPNKLHNERESAFAHIYNIAYTNIYTVRNNALQNNPMARVQHIWSEIEHNIYIEMRYNARGAYWNAVAAASMCVGGRCARWYINANCALDMLQINYRIIVLSSERGRERENCPSLSFRGEYNNKAMGVVHMIPPLQ